jgi:hypothetical protein
MQIPFSGENNLPGYRRELGKNESFGPCAIGIHALN